MNDKHTQDQLKNTKISIIGLGYVGLPLAIEFSKKYPTVGFDISKKRIDELKSGKDITLEKTKKDLDHSKIFFSNETGDIKQSNTYIITVPTPIDEEKNPDLGPLKSASELVGSVLKSNDVVIYESTVYPGATEEYCVPILEKISGLKYNQDFFCGYSPERINPGDKKHTLTKIVKVTSGSNAIIADYIDKLYKSINIVETYKASSIAVAEAAKVIENIQRDVNIALVNELSKIFNKLGLSTKEVLSAAKTKWNFIPFEPGLVGGHCIGVDPHYLTYKSSKIGYKPKIILAGRKINDSMGRYVADQIIKELKKVNIEIKGSRIGIMGLTFKENCPDIRNTRVPDIINHLSFNGCNVMVTDPYVNPQQAKELLNINLYEEEKIVNCNAIIIAVAHSQYRLIKKDAWVKILNNSGVIIDVKSIFSQDFFHNTNIVHWSL